MNRKLPDLALLIIFMIAITAPLIASPPSPGLIWRQVNSSEPNLSTLGLVKTWFEFPLAYSRYFDSHYLLHQTQVSAFQSVSHHLLHEKVFPNVLIAKQDWLYYTGENNIADFECTAPFSAEELQTIRSQLLGWKAQLEERGIHFYVVIAPNKETIYPQYLPDQVQTGRKGCRIDQVMDVLQDASLSVLDLRAALQSAAQTDQVYHRTDTHWNDTGALLAAQMIMSLVSRDFSKVTSPTIDDFYRDPQPFSGDLAAFLPPDDRFIEQAVFLRPSNPAAVKIEEGSDHTIIASLPGSDLPTALVFRDSFCDALIPFLSAHFSRVVFASSFSVDLDLIDREKPDVVIFEIAQRYLTVLR